MTAQHLSDEIEAFLNASRDRLQAMLSADGEGPEFVEIQGLLWVGVHSFWEARKLASDAASAERVNVQ